MAKIPVYNDLQVAPTNVQQVEFARQGNLFGGVGEGLQQAGQGLEQVAAIQHKEKEKADNTQGLMAFNNYREEIDASNQKFSMIPGMDAQAKSEEFRAEQQKIKEKYRSQLSHSQDALNLFDVNSISVDGNANSFINSHVDKETNKVATIVENEAVDGSARLAAANYASPAARDAALTQGDAAQWIQVKRLYGDNEKSKEIFKAKSESYRSAVHASVVSSLVDKNQINEAEAYFSQNKGSIQAEERNTLDAKLTAGRTNLEINAGGQAIATGAQAKYSKDIAKGNSAAARAEIVAWGVANQGKDPNAPAKAQAALRNLDFYTAAATDNTIKNEAQLIARGQMGNLTAEDRAYLNDQEKSDPARFRNLNNEINHRDNLVTNDWNLIGKLAADIRNAELAGDRAKVAQLKNDIVAGRGRMSSDELNTLVRQVDDVTKSLDKTPEGMGLSELKATTDQAIRTSKGVNKISDVSETEQYLINKHVRDMAERHKDEIRKNPNTLTDKVNQWVRDYNSKDKDIASSGWFNTWAAQENVSQADIDLYRASPAKSTLDPVARGYVGQLNNPSVAAKYQTELFAAAKNNDMSEVYALLRASGLSKKGITSELEKASSEINKSNKGIKDTDVTPEQKNTMENRVKLMLKQRTSDFSRQSDPFYNLSAPLAFQ